MPAGSVKLIKQTNPWNCGEAVLAMALGLDSCEAVHKLLRRRVEDEFDDLPADFDGKGGRHLGVAEEEIMAVLWAFGRPSCRFAIADQRLPQWYQLIAERTGRFTPEWVQTHIEGGQAMILGVDSKNSATAGHWIFVKDGQIYDPSTKVTYSWDDVPLPVQLVIFVDNVPRGR